MGDYAVASNVEMIFKANAALDWVVVSDDILDRYIDAHEAEINAALEVMEYTTIPATGTGDVALLKRHVEKVTAADIYVEQYPFEKMYPHLQEPDEAKLKLFMTKADNLLKLGQSWQNEYRIWLAQLASGDIRLADSVGDARQKGSMRAGVIDYNYIQIEDDD